MQDAIPYLEKMIRDADRKWGGGRNGIENVNIKIKKQNRNSNIAFSITLIKPRVASNKFRLDDEFHNMPVTLNEDS